MGTRQIRSSVIRAILFDLDGVLIDARRWHFDALNEALVAHGHPPIAEFHKYDGLPTRVKLEMLGIPESERAAISADKQRATLRLIHARAEPNIVHQACLARLRVDGYRIGICSNAVRPTVYAAMWRTGLAKLVDLVLSNDEVTHTKPDPEIYHKALACLRLRPTEALVVEDNDVGVRAAEAAGIPVLRVYGVMGVSYQSVMRRIREAERAVA